MNKMWIAILIRIMAAAMVLAGCKTTRAGCESAPYTVVRSHGNIEIRDYPALTVVETPMASTSPAADGSFNRLFRLITGGNDTKQKIAMTTPMFMSADGTNATMAFVMPAKMKSGEVPRGDLPCCATAVAVTRTMSHSLSGGLARG